jgi:putative mRNA 3-end processing factor
MLLQFTEKGIYCPAADVYIDPWQPVQRALITHGHSDHSRWGHQHYLCTHSAAPVIRHRLGDINLETVAYGEKRQINGVNFSFHPAGHIPGSAQIRVEHKGEVWVASGDYKLEADGLSEDFESVACHSFITESTFGLPVYRWEPQAAVFAQINEWWRQNAAEGKGSMITAYALGKAQRLLVGLDPSIGPIFTHGAVENTNRVMREQGIDLPATELITRETDRKRFPGSLIIAPPSALASPWSRQFKSLVTAAASGWMTLRGARRRRGVDRGFVLSDHADWTDLNRAIEASGAERVFVTHGYTDIFRRWLIDQGIEAYEVKTEYEGELAEMNEKPNTEDETEDQ